MICAFWSQKFKEWNVRFEGRFYKLNSKIGFGEGLKIVMKVTKNPKMIYDYGVVR